MRRLRPEEARLLRPTPGAEHVALISKVERLPWRAAPMVAADAALELLVAEVDPADDDGDVPWVSALVKLVETPAIGSRVARRWFVHLHRARGNDRPVSPSVEGIAAYAVAAFEGLLRRDHEVSRWMHTAALMTDFEGRTGLSLVVLVRAGRLLQPALRRWPPRWSP